MFYDVVACGYPSLDYILRVTRPAMPGETGILIDPLRLECSTLGGCSTNIAVACRRLGLTSGISAVIGDDAGGKRYLAALQAEKVDVSLLRIQKDRFTSSTILFVDPQGRHQTFFYPGAADEENELFINGVDDFSSAWGVITVGNARNNQQALAKFREQNIPILWSMKNDPYSYPPDLITGLSKYSRVIIMNAAEMESLKRLLHYERMSDFFNEKTDLIITTLGEGGSKIFTRSGEESVNSIPPDRLIDPTGAGDAYTSGVLLGLRRRLDYKMCARLGAVVSSFVLEEVGCQTGLPTLEQVKERYEKNFHENLPEKSVPMGVPVAELVEAPVTERFDRLTDQIEKLDLKAFYE